MSVWDDIGNAKDFNAKVPYIGEGRHKLLLKDFGRKNTEGGAPFVYANFMVLESNTHAVGTTVGKRWYLTDPTHIWKGERARSEAKAFVKALTGCDDADTIKTSEELSEKSNPGKGIAVFCNGAPPAAGKTFVQVTFEHVDQSREDVQRQRVMVDTGEIAATPKAEVKPAAPATTNMLSGLLGN